MYAAERKVNELSGVRETAVCFGHYFLIVL